jgi:hypothetical protein
MASSHQSPNKYTPHSNQSQSTPLGSSLASGAEPFVAALPGLRGVVAFPPDVVLAHVMVVVGIVDTHCVVHTVFRALVVHHLRRGVVLVDEQRGELPAQQVVHLPVRIPSGCRDSHEHSSLVQVECLLQVQGRGDHGGVHVVQIHIQQTKASAPVAIAAVLEIRVLSDGKIHGDRQSVTVIVTVIAITEAAHTHLQEPGREAVSLERRVQHRSLVEVGVVADAHSVLPVCDVRHTSGGGQSTGVVGGDVELTTLPSPVTLH